MTTLESICEAIVDCEHKTAPKAQTGHPSIRTTDIRNGRIDFENANRVSDATYDAWTRRRRPTPGDLILAREAPVGEVGYVPDGIFPVLGQRTVLISPDHSKVSSRYLHYLLISPQIQHEIQVRSAGSTVHHLNMKDIRELELPELPPLPKQREIASILGALDDKIELNRQTAATLEEMARALYRSWFVDFDPVHAKAAGQTPAHMDAGTATLFPDRFGPDGLPEGWKGMTLDDIAENRRRQIKPTDIQADTPYIGLDHMPRKSICLSHWGKADEVGSAKTSMARGQFLFGKLRPYFHKVGIAPVDGICSTDILVIEAKFRSCAELVLQVISSDSFVGFTSSHSAGTRMPRIKWNDMAKYPVVVATDPVMEMFSSIVAPMHARIAQISHESQALADLRDTLLPRLMSGALRVRDAAAAVAEVA